VKHLLAPPAVFFDTEKASDEYGLKMGIAWINDRGGEPSA
jgi:hypothetical protein